MNTAARRPISAQLIGGVGNQLFVYFAARYASFSSNRPLSLTYSENTTRHSSDLRRFTEFDFEPKRVSPVMAKAAGLLPGHSASPFISKHIHHLLKTHKSESVGYDPDISCIFRYGGLLRGYFQTFEYFDELGGGDTYGFTIENPSQGYSQHLGSLSSCIAVHVRRGDYLNPVNNYIGALSMKYFVDSVDLLSAQLGMKPTVIVFTDDSKKVKEELSEAGQSNWELFRPDSEITPEEEMLLMGHSLGLVISNSSFSWWAANIGPEKPIVAPQKWFREAEDPEKLVRESWALVNSDWRREC